MRLYQQFTLLRTLLLCSLFASFPLSASQTDTPWNNDDPFAQQAPTFLPVTEAYAPLLSLTGDNALQINWQITDGYYLYQKQFATQLFAAGDHSRHTLDYGDAIVKDDPYFGPTPVYYNFANATLKPLPDASTLLLKLTAQGCADAGLCYPPHDWFFKISKGGQIDSTTESVWNTAASSRSALPQNAQASGLWLMLIFALAGGIILNLMPCVFPVLGLKVLSFTNSGVGKAPVHGAIYSAGVIISFLVVALVLVGLKSAGAAVGWGFQLQTPWFVALLSCVFFVLSLNLLGAFEFSFIGATPGQTLSQRNDYVGSFFTGVLATVVATPCTAPFMGTALGFAATQTTLVSLLVFAALGIGMALPVYLLTLFPRALKALPRSGPWMEHLKQFLSFPLLATAIWLCWVIGRQTGVNGMGLTLLAWLALGLTIWCVGLRGKVAIVVAVLALIAAIALVNQTRSLTPEAQTAAQRSDGTLPYSAATLAELRAAGRPVFIDITADWCITCKVNERVALHTDAVRSAFAEKNVAYVIADWTRYDAHITALLDDYQRNGIPLYLLYVPGEERARILPQILTESLVLRAIETL